MKPPWQAAWLVVAAIVSLPLSGADKLILHEKRTSAQDLKLSGDLPGVPAGSVRFVPYKDLLKLPQATFVVSDDSNFPKKTTIEGVYLDQLLRSLDIPAKNTMVAANCDDDYEGHYTEDYRSAHHPILVLRVDGKQLSQYPRTGDGGTYGPYLISHATFTPRYHVLSHAEESQIPNGVFELRFLKEDTVLKAIRPPGKFSAKSPQMQGYVIAQQNCFRCHNAGAYGGRKAGRSWRPLAHLAQVDPKYFAAYIKDPQSQSASATMPANPEYDDATLAALTAYFQTFATEDAPK